MSLGDENPSPFYPLPFQPPNQTDKCLCSRACLGTASFFVGSDRRVFYLLSLPCTSSSFFSPSPWLKLLLTASLWMMNCNRSNKRREKITFYFRIYTRPRDVSVMNHTPVTLRYTLATHHRIKKETHLKWDAFPKQIHQKRSYLALAQFFEVQISGKSNNVCVNLIFQTKGIFARFYRQAVRQPIIFGLLCLNG